MGTIKAGKRIIVERAFTARASALNSPASLMRVISRVQVSLCPSRHVDN
jgi:hypothetical protein